MTTACGLQYAISAETGEQAAALTPYPMSTNGHGGLEGRRT